MDVFDEVLSANQAYAERYHDAGLPTRPARRLAVLCCMDSRIDLFAVLGLRSGEAHIVRNAGGLVTEDAVRSLALSHWVLGTEAILVIQHTRCGLEGLDEEAVKERIRTQTGGEPPARFGRFDDVTASTAGAVQALRSNPVFKEVKVRGAVFDVDTGRLTPVD